ncbi:MAG: LuxR C-terminal-related transcriptional regulator [Firmicutes bacterium]|nr:LuxR C-terminal-related transcriptional regulator [Bacillota bacterium]
MQVIRYEFADGTVSEIEVSDEFYAVHEEMVKAEKCNHWKNTRRHVSLTYLQEREIDIPAPDGDMLSALIHQEEKEEYEKSIFSRLSEKQIELLKMVWAGYSVTEIATHEGVTHQAISQRLETILKKIKVFSGKPCNLPSAVLIGRGSKTAYYKLRGLAK